MIQLVASTRSREYPVFLSEGLLDETGRLWCSLGNRDKVVVIADDNVAALHLARLAESLAAAGVKVNAVKVRPGEKTKSLENAALLYTRLFDLKTRRQDAVCALGGGVVGDLAGFVASTYMRGVKLIQIPTSLLSQVDSSIGGKVGVNIPEAKNYVGAFYQPHMVVTDPDLLTTLPRRELVEGLAEVVKYCLLTGDDFFSNFEASYEEFLSLNMAYVEPVVRRCIEYKLRIVSEDERDFGRRAVLNLGHTVGHGIEAAGAYKAYSHGRAVALGLLAAVRLSTKVFGLPDRYSERLQSLLLSLGLPVRLEEVRPRDVLAAMASDKKSDDLSANMVLLKTLGEPVTNCDVDASLVKDQVERLAEGD